MNLRSRDPDHRRTLRDRIEVRRLTKDIHRQNGFPTLPGFIPDPFLGSHGTGLFFPPSIKSRTACMASCGRCSRFWIHIQNGNGLLIIASHWSMHKRKGSGDHPIIQSNSRSPDTKMQAAFPTIRPTGVLGCR